MKKRTERIEIVNEIIKTIASTGRHFFLNGKTGEIAYIHEKVGKLYLRAESNPKWQNQDVYLHRIIPPSHFRHDGTMWGLVIEFKEFIITGKYVNGKYGDGGLYCASWGYKKEEMRIVVDKAIELGYLEKEYDEDLESVIM